MKNIKSVEIEVSGITAGVSSVDIDQAIAQSIQIAKNLLPRVASAISAGIGSILMRKP
jgi:hypothetical protein